MTKRFIIGISSCLLGNRVRYDGGHKLDLCLRDELGPLVEWMSVCPEVECGLPVPREAMQLVGGKESTRLVATESGIDHTEQLTRWLDEKLAEPAMQNLCGFVFKARSPSCGVRDALIVLSTSGASAQGAGLFAGAVLRRFPDLPVADEEQLHEPAVRDEFIRKISAYKSPKTSN
jgi:uncharacterized protein YbbK (DUF523 family)